MDRHTRKLINNKQDNLLNITDGSISRLVEGQLSVGQKLGEHLSLVLRKGKRLFKIHLSPDGDFYVDKHHFVKGNAFVDGTVYGNQIHWYAHNFTAIRAEFRSEFVGGNTVMGFHRASNGTTNPSTTPIESITRNIASADTTYEYRFTGAASFNRGDVVSISVDPTSNVHEVNVTTIWSFNILK
jgi:hypothetical protein